MSAAHACYGSDLLTHNNHSCYCERNRAHTASTHLRDIRARESLLVLPKEGEILGTIRVSIPGVEYIIELPDGTQRVVSDAQDEYWAIARVLDGEH